MNRRRIFDAFRHARPPEEAQDWMPLAEAANAVRSAERDSDLDRMARGLGESEDILLAFWAQHVAQLGVPIYGCRMLSSKREIIPKAVILAGKIRDQATRLEVSGGNAINDFGALAVERREFATRVARVGNGDATSG